MLARMLGEHVPSFECSYDLVPRLFPAFPESAHQAPASGEAGTIREGETFVVCAANLLKAPDPSGSLRVGTVVSSAEYAAWVAHGGYAGGCFPTASECYAGWPQYVSLDADCGHSGADAPVATLQQLLDRKGVQCTVTSLAQVSRHTVGDQRGRAPFVKSGSLESENGRQAIGTDYVEVS